MHDEQVGLVDPLIRLLVFAELQILFEFAGQ